MDQGFLGILDRALDRLQLLGDLQTRPVVFDHFDDGLKVTVGALQAPYDCGMILVRHSIFLLSYRQDIEYPPGWITKNLL
jgi:hypothetical protein